VGVGEKYGMTGLRGELDLGDPDLRKLNFCFEANGPAWEGNGRSRLAGVVLTEIAESCGKGRSGVLMSEVNKALMEIFPLELDVEEGIEVRWKFECI
jgi:hypothetical protein